MVMRRGFVFVVVGAMLLTLVAGIAVAQNFNIIQCEDEDPEVPCVGTRGADRIIERDGSKHDDNGPAGVLTS